MLATRMRQAASKAVELWTPASPTDEGGVLPHTFLAPGVANFQDAAKTTVAGLGDVVGAVVNGGSDTYDATQGTTAKKPILVQRTISTVTGYYWNHDGGDDWLQGAFGGGAISQPYTAFAVAQLDAAFAADSSNHNMTDGDDGSARMVIYKQTTKTWSLFCGTNLAGGSSDSGWNIFTAVPNGASSVLRKNGVSIASGDAGPHALDGITIGANYLGSGVWKGDIGPILIYEGNLSTADKNQVGEYLERVTGIAWTEIT